MASKDIVSQVRDHYGEIARGERSGCGCGDKTVAAASIGYSADDLALAGDANLGLGCGNPLALAELKPGMTVLDLGSGAGFDAFLAWRQVGSTGRVIGVDMTDDMLAKARENAAKLGAGNVEFRKGLIEELPLENNSVDFVISNCVINLSTDKPAVFREIHRVLKAGGRFSVSDIVLLANLPPEIAQDVSAYVGCLAGACPMHDYVRMAIDAGFADLSIPEIQHGRKLSSVLAPEDGPATCCGSNANRIAAEAVASIKLHGRKI